MPLATVARLRRPERKGRSSEANAHPPKVQVATFGSTQLRKTDLARCFSTGSKFIGGNNYENPAFDYHLQPDSRGLRPCLCWQYSQDPSRLREGSHALGYNDEEVLQGDVITPLLKRGPARWSDLLALEQGEKRSPGASRVHRGFLGFASTAGCCEPAPKGYHAASLDPVAHLQRRTKKGGRPKPNILPCAKPQPLKIDHIGHVLLLVMANAALIYLASKFLGGNASFWGFSSPSIERGHAPFDKVTLR